MKWQWKWLKTLWENPEGFGKQGQTPYMRGAKKTAISDSRNHGLDQYGAGAEGVWPALWDCTFDGARARRHQARKGGHIGPS